MRMSVNKKKLGEAHILWNVICVNITIIENGEKSYIGDWTQSLKIERDLF